MPVRPSILPIGLDLGDGFYRAAQCERTTQGVLRCRRLARGGFDTDSEGPEALARLWRTLERQGFVGDSVNVIAPPDRVRVESMETPPVGSGAPIDTIVRAELSRRGATGGGPAEIGWWPLPGGESVYAACIAEPEVESMLDRFGEIGAGVEVIDIESHALARACAQLRRPEWEGVGVLASIEHGSIALIAMHEGIVVYERHLHDVPWNGRAVDRRFAERLADELLICLEFTDERYRAEGEGWAVLAGCGAAGLGEHVERLTHVPTAEFRADAVMEVVPSEALGDSPEMARALGLAMRTGGGS